MPKDAHLKQVVKLTKVETTAHYKVLSQILFILKYRWYVCILETSSTWEHACLTGNLYLPATMTISMDDNVTADAEDHNVVIRISDGENKSVL